MGVSNSFMLIGWLFLREVDQIDRCLSDLTTVSCSATVSVREGGKGEN